MRGGPGPGWQALDGASGAGQVKCKLSDTRSQQRESGRSGRVVELDRKAALHAGPREERFVQAPDVRKIVQRDLVALVPPGPAENREVRHR